MFGRRTQRSFLEKTRESVWPQIGWRRAFQYGWRRIWRLSGTPHAIALGVAVGGFAACTPFIGFHMVMAIAMAWLVRGNILAAIMGNLIGNPLTLPVILLVTYEVGAWILGTPPGQTALPTDLSFELFLDQGYEAIKRILLPMMIGCIPIGLLVSLICYVPVRSAVETYQKNKRERLYAARGNF